MWAKVWPTRRSASLSERGRVPKIPSAPKTMPAARMGTACPAAKPASSAAGTNRGQRSASVRRSATLTVFGGDRKQAKLIERVGEQEPRR